MGSRRCGLPTRRAAPSTRTSPRRRRAGLRVSARIVRVLLDDLVARIGTPRSSLGCGPARTVRAAGRRATPGSLQPTSAAAAPRPSAQRAPRNDTRCGQSGLFGVLLRGITPRVEPRSPAWKAPRRGPPLDRVIGRARPADARPARAHSRTDNPLAPVGAASWPPSLMTDSFRPRPAPARRSRLRTPRQRLLTSACVDDDDPRRRCAPGARALLPVGR